MKKEEQFEMIENYLAGQLSVKERAAFEQAVRADEELAWELEVQRDMHQLMATQPIDDLRNNLKAISLEFDEEGKAVGTKEKGKPKSNGWRWPLLGVFLLLGVWGVVHLSSSAESPTSALENQSTPASSEVERGEEEASEMATPIEEKEAQSPTETVAPAPQQQQTTTPAPTPTEKIKDTKNPPPIAFHYEPNPAIEAELSSGLRGDYDFEIVAPAEEAKLAIQNGQTTFLLEGTLDTDKTPEDDFSLVLEMYSNRKEDYEEGDFLVQLPLELEGGATPYGFRLSVAFEAEAWRLYYYLVKDVYSGAVLTGGRIMSNE